MTGNLDEVIGALLIDSLPELLGGTDPPVTLEVVSAAFTVDPRSAESLASAPRPDDRTDEFPFDPEDPPASFTLTQPPYPGPLRVRLTTAQSDRIPLRRDEVIRDPADSRVFSLALRPSRDLSGVEGVQVLYGVTSIFTHIKADQVLTLRLESDSATDLERAEALALGVIELNRQALVDASPATFEDGDYGATVTVKSLRLVEGTSPSDTQRHLAYHAEIEVKAVRALREDEGEPIVRIRTTSRPLDPDRRIDVQIDLDA